MQLTPEMLQQFAENMVKKRIAADPSIMAAYQCGSTLLDEAPLLGGTTDIDVVLIHTLEPPVAREIQRLMDEIHLDISHHSQDLYRNGRQLRVHPWMGPTLNTARPIYDPRHFLDFTQASVRGMFSREDFILERAQALYDQARQSWMDLLSADSIASPAHVAGYIKAVENAANSLALLVGNPLTERRFLLDFPRCAEALGEPRMVNGLYGLLGAHRVDDQDIQSWLSGWSQSYDAVPGESRPAHLHTDRKNYYQRAFDAIVAGDDPKALLWPLINTWTRAAVPLSHSDSAYQGWVDAFQQLELLTNNPADRVAALDAFLDQVNDTLNRWGGQPRF
jgi:hypothetical protein